MFTLNLVVYLQNELNVDFNKVKRLTYVFQCCLLVHG